MAGERSARKTGDWPPTYHQMLYWKRPAGGLPHASAMARALPVLHVCGGGWG